MRSAGQKHFWGIRWREHFTWNPMGTMAALGAIVLGSIGAVVGDEISQGMTNSLSRHANPIVHIWGVMFALGGLASLYGLYRNRSLVEIPGLWLLASGYGFYAITVIAGLGYGGMAAGIIATSQAAGCLLKVNIIMRRAHAFAASANGDGADKDGAAP